MDGDADVSVVADTRGSTFQGTVQTSPNLFCLGIPTLHLFLSFFNFIFRRISSSTHVGPTQMFEICLFSAWSWTLSPAFEFQLCFLDGRCSVSVYLGSDVFEGWRLSRGKIAFWPGSFGGAAVDTGKTRCIR